MRSFFSFSRASSFVVASLVAVGCGSSDATADSTDSGSFDAPADRGGDDTATIDSAHGDAPVDSPLDTIVVDTGSSDAIPDGDASGKPCTAGGAECAKTEYCDAPSCGSGHCAARPAGPSVDFQPVCGCDGVTYWNAQQAHASGASTDDASTGSSCSGPSTKTCGGLAGTKCATGEACVEDLSGFGSCLVSDAGGQCWFVPSGASCSGVSFSQYRDCTSSTCVSYCEAVKGGHSFRRDSTCPT